MAFHFPGSSKEWEARTGSENRVAISGLIRQRRATGLLAYLHGKPVAWCNVAPRTTLAGLNNLKELQVDDPEQVGSIVCFIVAAPYRRKGIGRILLDAACENLTRHGLAFAEAYPSKTSKSSADNYPGPLEMYLRAGFTRFRESEWNLIVRKPLLNSD